MSSYLFPILVVIQVISSLAIIGLVLLQQGKGADMGSSFGGGSAGSLFGAAGSANFFSRMTKWAAVAFFASTLGLAWVSSGGGIKAPKPTDGGSVMEGYSATPVVPGAGSVAGSAVVGGDEGNSTTGNAVPSVPKADGGSDTGSTNVESGNAVPSIPQTNSKPNTDNKTQEVQENKTSVDTLTPAELKKEDDVKSESEVNAEVKPETEVKPEPEAKSEPEIKTEGDNKTDGEKDSLINPTNPQ
ncbi:preprotein translocase subunit SecG [Taylorella equigenitalis]|nr:preprotein translocase subunit SecG [Taylorella equigenitalis]